MAQHASPNVTGQMDERRAHWTIFSTVVVRTGISDSSPMMHPAILQFCKSSRRLSAPVERAFAPDIDVAGEEQQHEDQDLHEPVPPQLPQRHRPGIEERDLDVEEQK